MPEPPSAMLVALWSAILLVFVLLRTLGLPTWAALVGCTAIAVTTPSEVSRSGSRFHSIGRLEL